MTFVCEEVPDHLRLFPEGTDLIEVATQRAVPAEDAARVPQEVASLELGPSGIRVNLIHPGYIETSMVANAPASFRQVNIDSTPLGTVGHVEDVANLVVFLISDESAYISGAEIAVDGGFSNQAGVKALSDAVLAAAPPTPPAATADQRST